MELRPKGLRAMPLVIVGCCFIAASSSRSWDLAVTVGNQVDFISQNGSLIGKTIIANSTALVAMAYDEESYTLFLSDAKNRDFSIFSVDLKAKNITLKPLLKRDTDSQILGMTFDSQTRQLFWTTDKAIVKMKVPVIGRPSRSFILHKFETESPRGIALDVCNRHIYWSNSDRVKPRIMRSNLDGTNVTTIISDNLYEPSAIAIDHSTSRLYWIDDEEGIHYKLEQSNLDGTNRSIVIHGKHQQPVHLTVNRNGIFWTDFVYSAIWTIAKDTHPGDMPKKFKSYFDPNRQADPTSILARDNTEASVDCKVMKSEAVKRATNAAGTTTLNMPKPTQQSFNNLTTSTEVQDVCYNGGSLIGSTCRCKPGYSGTRCEISACYNYCLRGNCFVNELGQPICHCGESFSGDRCEHDICNGYCLNGGRCSVDDGKPTCECKYSSGTRCEVTFDVAEICTLYCMNRQLQVTSIDTSSCRCSELNQTIEDVLNYDTFNCAVLLPLLAGLSGMLGIVVVFLIFYVSRLSRKPRIKKRFVVNKQTPLTSRPGQVEQCEITIENCCNMNICETPCFEPQLRGSGRSSNNSKKEEKSNLLDHMENNGQNC